MHEPTDPTLLPPTDPSSPVPGDPLTEVPRRGARTLLAQAVEAEVAAWIDERAEVRDEAGRRQVVRNGRLPGRSVLTGVGPVEVKAPRVRDKRPPGGRAGARRSPARSSRRARARRRASTS